MSTTIMDAKLKDLFILLSLAETFFQPLESNKLLKNGNGTRAGIRQIKTGDVVNGLKQLL